MRSISILAMASASALAMAAPALSQEANMSQAQSPQQFELTDRHVTAFVHAARGINDVVEELGPQMEAAETDAARQDIQEQAQTQMAEIVTDSGLTVMEYNSIANAAQTDEDIAGRIRATAQEMDAAQ